jgi:hypothetical protein
MKIKFILIVSILFLSSCSITDQTTKPTTSNTWDTSIIENSWSIETLINDNSVTVWANEQKEINLILNNNKWNLKINYWTWARVSVLFNSVINKNLTVKITTPWDKNGNIRISQIILPDKMADGPFWKELIDYKLTESGTYQLVLFANMMAWDPWSWIIDLNLEIK